MPNKTYWLEGDYKALCDGCGFEFKASELKERYDGMMVCPQDWEPRHPLERSFAIRGPRTLPWTRPEPDDVFITGLCTASGRQGVADFGTADCACADIDLGLR